MQAAKLGQDAAIKILLAAGANPAPLNSEHQCPLHLAALHGQEVAARLLLAAAPASAGVHDAVGNLALHYAAEMVSWASADCHAELRICFGMQECKRHQANRALLNPNLLLIQGHLAIVRLLTASRRGLDERNLQGETALHLAAAAGHHFCAEQLDKAGAHSLPDALRRTPLMRAAAAGHTAAVQALLDSGAAAVDAGDSEGATALLMAAQAGAADTVAALLAGGATADAAGRQGIAPVHAAAAAGHEAVMRVLAAHGAWLNAWAGGRGDQPLHLAAAAGHEAVIRALLDCSADPRAINADGCTAVHAAAAAGQATCLELLLGGMGGGSNGCSSWLVDAADNQGRTALHHAVAGGHLAAVECLLGAGASIHAQDASGATPVEQALAAHGGGPEAQAIKELLLQAAAVPADPGERVAGVHFGQAGAGHLVLAWECLPALAALQLRWLLSARPLSASHRCAGAAQEQVPLPPPPHHVRCKPSAPPAQAQDLGTCCYCLSSQCDTAFAPCGHRACCRRCAEVLLAAPEAGRLCPVCRDQASAGSAAGLTWFVGPEGTLAPASTSVLLLS